MSRTRIVQSFLWAFWRDSGYLAIVLAAFVPYANFAAVNAGESISIQKLFLYALVTLVGGVLLSLVLGLFPRSSNERAAFAVSVFLVLFFCFSITELLAGVSGIGVLIIHSAAMLIMCSVCWWLAGYAGFRRFWILALGVVLAVSTGTYAVRLSRLQSASGSTDSAATSTLSKESKHPINTARLEYRELGTTAAVIPPDPKLATPTDGASFLGTGLTPKRANSTLRVRVVANIYSAADATAVIAVFRVAEGSPAALQSKPVPAGGRALFDITFYVPSNGRLPVSFDVRAGAASAATLLINGPDLNSKPADVPMPYISVTEINPSEVATSLPDRRNVYYLTLDAYPRADILKEVFNYDNTPFIDDLKSKGFVVAKQSYANYFTTDFSVPAAMEHSFIVDESNANIWEKLPWLIAVMNGKNRVFHEFQDLGYFTGKLNFWDLCPPDAFVDYCYVKKSALNPWISAGVTDMELSLMQLTPLYTLLQLVDPDFFKSRVILEDVDDAMRLVSVGESHRPRFIYAHVFLPHAPYRFTADCGWSKTIDIGGDRSPDPKRRFLDQVLCANRKALEFVAQVVKDDPDAIILINSDHGSGFDIDWSLPLDRWPEAAIRQRLGNFDAMRLPARCKQLFYDTISPVNYFELVFSCVEDRSPTFLQDRIYISTFDKSNPQYGRVWRYR